MVSARLKKRFIALVFLSSIAVVFLYKVQHGHSDYIARGLKQTKDFSRWVLRTRSLRCYIVRLAAQRRVSARIIATFIVHVFWLKSRLNANTAAQRLTLKDILSSYQLLSWRFLKLILTLYSIDWIFSHPSIYGLNVPLEFPNLVLRFIDHPQFSVLRKFFQFPVTRSRACLRGNRTGSQTRLALASKYAIYLTPVRACH